MMHIRRKIMNFGTCLALLLFLGSCMSYQDSKPVTRIGSDEVIDLSGNWNDTDSRLVAEEMVESILKAPWRKRFDEPRNPVVIVGTIGNKTSEHIDTTIFTKEFESALVNSGEIDFVASSKERGGIRDERLSQQSYSSEETMKRLAQEVGADFMLIGSINSEVDETADSKVVNYLVSMELVNVETNIKAWVGTKRIRKLIDKQARAKEESFNRLNRDW